MPSSSDYESSSEPEKICKLSDASDMRMQLLQELVGRVNEQSDAQHSILVRLGTLEHIVNQMH